MNPSPLDSTFTHGSLLSSVLGDTTTNTGIKPPLPEPELTNLAVGPRITWRRRVLLLLAILGCVGVFLLARLLAGQPEVPAEWRHTPEGRLELASSPLPELKPFLGQPLQGLRTADGRLLRFSVLTTAHSARWFADTHHQASLQQVRIAAAQAVEAGPVRLVFTDGAEVSVRPQPRGYGGLGAMFWLMSTFALVLYLVGWIVPLVQPQGRNLLYATMAQAQVAQLALAAVSSLPSLTQPSLLVAHEAGLRSALDLLTGAAIVHACLLHPARLPGGGVLALLAWLTPGILGALWWQGALDAPWLWSQGLMVADGLACIGVLTWANRQSPQPFALVMRRFAMITVGTLALLTLAVWLMPLLPDEVQPVAAVGPVIWGVFFASVILLVPFVARSQSVMREFAMLAGVSTMATSVDLLFVAVFSFSQFASLTLSLFLALGAYAAVRHWLMNQIIGARTLTTERMFEHLYRIAREVEARPERAADRMIDLLRHVFEPLETERLDGRMKYSRVTGNGAMLLVPLPNLTEAPTVSGVVGLRFAERGKRLFTLEDARLADRIVQQLMRAVAHDRAVERGRSEERARIAQDLHDDIGARLLTLMYQAPTKEMEDYVRHTLQDLKTLTRGLASKAHPLALALAEWKTDIDHRLEAAGLSLAWNANIDQDLPLTVVQWSSLTRILRELVSNVIAHSKAKHIEIDCTLQEGQFVVIVKDDGEGREPARWSHGLGLGGIRKRVKLMGGSVQWREREGRGIVCSVIIPRLST
ncbi:sensor histidine kinase [Ideonella livida]|uniref:histidine kinase n=1 Tax=Ideonella livida TaxID=2707176 RepID=A0A7C9THZ9_9BURK|nr:ATP-binding protein [Ideonella livida]NDY90044.1 histidine kinase [Ideonella livida]